MQRLYRDLTPIANDDPLAGEVEVLQRRRLVDPRRTVHQQIRKFILKHRQVGARVGYRRPYRDVAGCRPGNPYALG